MFKIKSRNLCIKILKILQSMQRPQPQILVIFGASGDLAKRKLIPALYNLYHQSGLPKHYAILGVGRKSFTDDSFREKIEYDTNIDEKNFLNHLYYVSMDTKKTESYAKLRDRLSELDQRLQTQNNFIYYCATPPAMYSTIAYSLSYYGLNKTSGEEGNGWKRIIFEKPFGSDLQSAKQLNKELRDHFDEEQIYRIDHYLGKETVQNILVTRFSNNIFEPLWNRNYIDHIQITSAESIGIEKRGEYYDSFGAIRDMLQNHLLQLVSLIAMEPPALSSSEAIRNENLKVFQSLRPLTPYDIQKYVIRGQYTAGSMNNVHYPGYKEEEGVAVHSDTETFVALKLNIDNWRWKDVPFFIRTGKRMPRRATEIVIQFKPTPHHIFCTKSHAANNPNQLIIRIQPDEGILLRFGMKIPGAGFEVQDVNMNFHYSDLADIKTPTAYERLILDSMQGDPTLYLRGDAVEATWSYLAPLLEYIDKNNSPVYEYPAGTWGPQASMDLIAQETGYHWRNPCKNIENDASDCEL